MHKHNVEPAKALTHPAFVAAATLLFLNDHLFKGSGVLPAWITGKASDFAGLLVAPVVFAWCLRVRDRRAFALVHVLVGAVFAALEVSPSFTTSVAAAIDPVFSTRMVADLTDLMALPTLLVSFFVFGRTVRASETRAPRILAQRALGVAALLSCCATSRAMPGALATDGSHVVAQQASFASNVVVIDGKTGAFERQLAANNGEWRSTIVEGIVYSGGAEVNGFELATGKKVFASAARGNAVTVVGADLGYVYARVVREGTPAFVIVDRKTGQTVSEGPMPGDGWNVSFLSVSPGRFAIREEDTITIRSPERTLARLDTGDASIVGHAVDDRRAVVVTDDGDLLGFDVTTGERVFARPKTAKPGGLAVRGETIAYAAEEGIVLARASDGSRVRTIPGGGFFVLEPDGIFVYVAKTGRIESWSLEGQVRWSAPVTIEWFVDLVVTKEAVVYRDGDDTIVGLSRRDGRPAFTFSFDSLEEK